MRFFRFLPLAFLALPVLAQMDDPDRIKEMHPDIANTEGWNFRFQIGFDNPNLNFAQFVPGIDDATLLHLGGTGSVTLTFLSGPHEWRNKVNLSIGYNLDQFVSDFVKARDSLTYDTNYYFSFMDRFWGAYGQFNLDTHMLPGLDIQPADAETTYNVYDNNGVLVSSTTGTRIQLTNAFAPLILTENLGLFVRPVTIPAFSYEAKLSAYFNQGLVGGKLVIIDVDDTPDPSITTVATLENFFQIGMGLTNQIWGSLGTDFIYSANVAVSYAFYDHGSVSDLPQTFANNISMIAGVGLRYQPFKYFGFSWEGRAKYQPYIRSEFQLDSFLSVDLAYSL